MFQHWPHTIAIWHICLFFSCLTGMLRMFRWTKPSILHPKTEIMQVTFAFKSYFGIVYNNITESIYVYYTFVISLPNHGNISWVHLIFTLDTWPKDSPKSVIMYVTSCKFSRYLIKHQLPSSKIISMLIFALFIVMMSRYSTIQNF